MNFPCYVADRSRHIGTTHKNKSNNNKKSCTVKESASTLAQLRQYLLEELKLNGILKKLPHDSRTMGHERFFTKSDGFTLQSSED